MSAMPESASTANFAFGTITCFDIVAIPYPDGRACKLNPGFARRS
jgi:hypothetical protein